MCAASWEGPVHFPLRGFLREREVGWLLVWECWFLNGSYFSLLRFARMGIKAAEALIWAVQLSFVKGNLIRRARD